MPASKAQRAETAKRRSQAIALRLAGVDYEGIATRLGYSSRGAAYTDISRALEQAVAEQRHSGEVLRQAELLRLDRLQAGVWAQAVAGDTRSADTALRIIDRRIRLLGLDAPQRHEIITLSEIDEEIRKLTAELGDPVGEEGVSGEHANGGGLLGRPETGTSA